MSRQHPVLLALFHKLSEGHVLVDGKLHHNTASQVQEKSLQFLVIGLNFQRFDLALESLVHIEQKKEYGDELHMGHGVDVVEQRRQLGRILALEENFGDGTDGLMHELEQERVLVGRKQQLNHIR